MWVKGDHGCNPQVQWFDVLPLFRNGRDPGTRKSVRAFDRQTAASQPPSLAAAFWACISGLSVSKRGDASAI